MLVLETEVFKLRLDGEEAEAVGEGSVDIKCLAGNLIALVWCHAAEGAHIVEAVGHLDEHHADILAHGEEELAEILGLYRGAVAENAARDFGEPVDELRNLRAKMLLDVVYGIVGVFHHIMEQSRADTRRAEAYLARGYAGHGDRVHDIRFARTAAHTLVGLLGKLKCTLDDFDFLAVVAVEITGKELVESTLYHFFFLLWRQARGIVHNPKNL